MKEYFTAKEIAEILGVSRQTIDKRARKEKWPYQQIKGRARGGKQKQYILSSLPQDIRFKLIRALSPVENNPNTVITHIQSQRQLAPVSSQNIYHEPTQLPQWAERIALARADLVRAFRAEKEAAKKRGEKVLKAAENFIKSYNSALLFPKIYEILGQISIKTLYVWDKTLSEAEDDYTALAPRWGHNKGQRKITEDEKNILLDILLYQNQIKINTAIRIAKHILAQRGIPSPSSYDTMRRWVKEWRAQNYDLWTLLREGEKGLNDKVLPYLKRNADLLGVGEVLVADGKRCNFQVINPFTGKPYRPALILFYDWASRFPVGISIMIQEDTQAIACALADAIITLGKMPKAVILDNGKAFKAKIFTSEVNLEEAGIYGMYARLGIHTHFCWPYNAQSKPVERFFGTFNEWFERMLPSYVGQNIDDKPAYLKRNEKLAKRIKGKWIPTIPQVIQLFYSWREFYASQPHRGLRGRTPGEVFNAGKGPGVDVEQLFFLMMPYEVKQVFRNGISFLGNQYWNENLYGLREKVIIRYIFTNLSRIYVFDLRGNYLGPAELVESVHPAVFLIGNPLDMQAVKQGISQKKRLKKQTVQLAKAAIQSGRSLPELPWNEVVSQVPNIPETIERIEAETSAPDETKFIKDIQAIEQKVVQLSNKQKEKRGDTDSQADDVPFFGADTWRAYEWYRQQYLEKGRPLRDEKEVEFIKWFITTDMYRLIYKEEDEKKGTPWWAEAHAGHRRKVQTGG